MASTITTAVGALLAFSLLLALYLCLRCGITSFDDLRNYREARRLESPIVQALFNGRVGPGSPSADVLAIESPHTREEHGRYALFHFTSPGAFGYRTLKFVDGKAVAAEVGSCTWHWQFFDETPDEIASAYAGLTYLKQFGDVEDQGLQTWIEGQIAQCESTLGVVTSDDEQVAGPGAP